MQKSLLQCLPGHNIDLPFLIKMVYANILRNDLGKRGSRFAIRLLMIIIFLPLLSLICFL